MRQGWIDRIGDNYNDDYNSDSEEISSTDEGSLYVEEDDDDDDESYQDEA